MTTILVTGSTGTVGSRLVAELARSPNVTVRAATRNPDKATTRAPNVTFVELDLSRPDTMRAAMRGADKLFSLVPLSEEHVAVGKRLIDIARQHDVAHVVELSTASAGQGPEIPFGRWHRASEEHIEASGIPYTLLRPGLFMTDFIYYWAPDPTGSIYLPFGDGASSYIDPEDIAGVAALALTTDGHAGKTYTLTGSEALTVTQIAEQLGGATGRPIRYIDVPDAAARGAMESAGMPGWMVTGMLEMFATVKAGHTAPTTTTVREITGREPRTFAEFARAHAAAWR